MSAPMSPEARAAQQRHEAEMAAIRRQEQVVSERSEVRRTALASLKSQVNVASLEPEQAHQLDLTFAFGSDDQLAGFRVAEYAGGESPAAADHFANPDGSRAHAFERTVGAKRSTRIVVPPGAEVPEGYSEIGNLADHRREAEQRRAIANARRATDRGRGLVGDGIDANAGTSPDGLGTRQVRGQEVAELRPQPLDADADLATALAELPGLAEGTAPDILAEAERLIREYAAEPDRLKFVALAETIGPGPEGEPYAWRRLVQWDPAGGYPSVEKNGPGTRVVTLRQLLQLARGRRDARLIGGPEHASLAVRSPFGTSFRREGR